MKRRPRRAATSSAGLPSAAANLARQTHAPDTILIYESGTIGAKPTVLPLSIGDGELCETALTTVIVGVGVLALVEAQTAFLRVTDWSSHAATAPKKARRIEKASRCS